jgi:hypothetical protein
VQRVADLPANRLYTVTELANHDRVEPPDAVEVPMFAQLHDRQPLLARRLSKLGPGIACADVDRVGPNGT